VCVRACVWVFFLRQWQKSMHLLVMCYDLKYAYMEINKLKWGMNPKQTFTEK